MKVFESPQAVSKNRLRKAFADARGLMSARIWARRNVLPADLFSAIQECTGLVLEFEAVGAFLSSDLAWLVARSRSDGLSIEQALELRSEVEATIGERVAPLIVGFSAIDLRFITSSLPDAATFVIEFVGAAWLLELSGRGTLRIMGESARRGRSIADPAEKRPTKVPSFRRRDPQEVLAEAQAVVKSQRERIQWARRRIIRDRNPETAPKRPREEVVNVSAQAFAAIEALDLAERSRPYQERNGELFKG